MSRTNFALGVLASLFLPTVVRAAPPDPAPAKPAAAPAPAAPKPAPPAAKPAPVAPAPGAAAAAAAKPAPAAPAPAPGAPAPAPAAPAAAKPVSAAPAPTAPEKPLDAAKKGVVSIERGGHALALGVLLRGDGRILTALSPLTHGNQLDARYPDGSVVHARISHSDRASDLALLTPEGDFSRNGLRASQELPPDAGAKLHAFRHVGDKTLVASDVAVKARVTLRGADGAELENALELAVAPGPADLGGPLLDDKGEVVAVTARACASSDKTGCTLAPYGASATSLRRFLRSVPQRKAPSVGLDGVSFDTGVARGVRLVSVQAESRAALAGLHGGEPGVADVVVAVDGVAVTTPEAMNDALERHPASLPLRVLVLSGGQYREVSLGTTSPRPPAAGSEPKPAEAGPRHERTIQSGPWPHGPKPTPGPAAPPPAPPR